MEQHEDWRELLASWTEDSSERSRLIQAIGISPQTLSRWVNTGMNPQPQKLLKLLAALSPTQAEQIRPLLPITSSVISTSEESVSIAQGFYSSVLHTATALPKNMLFNRLASMIVEQAVVQLDPYRSVGIAVTLAECQPPDLSGKVRSLYETFGRGTPPWPMFLEQQAMFRGAESLAGSALVTGHVMTVKTDAQSVAAAPIMRMGTIAGSLSVVSAQPNFFTSAHLQFVGDLAELLTVAFTQEQFYDPANIQLAMMPNQDVQRSHLSSFQQRVMQAMIQAARDQQPLSLPQAEQMIRRSMEAELLQLA
jgi:hypothetical protein